MAIAMARKNTDAPKPNGNIRLIACHLNEAFQTTDLRQICNALDDVIRSQNVSELALKTGIDRARLYSVFRPKDGPRYSTVMIILNALGLGFVAEPRARLEKPQQSMLQNCLRSCSSPRAT